MFLRTPAWRGDDPARTPMREGWQGGAGSPNRGRGWGPVEASRSGGGGRIQSRLSMTQAAAAEGRDQGLVEVER
jgi:hypothetical protein